MRVKVFYLEQFTIFHQIRLIQEWKQDDKLTTQLDFCLSFILEAIGIRTFQAHDNYGCFKYWINKPKSCLYMMSVKHLYVVNYFTFWKWNELYWQVQISSYIFLSSRPSWYELSEKSTTHNNLNINVFQLDWKWND